MTIVAAKGGMAGLLVDLETHTAACLSAASVLLRRPERSIGLRNEPAMQRPAVMKPSLPGASVRGECKRTSEPSPKKAGGRWTLKMQATGANIFTCLVGWPLSETVQLLVAALEQEGIRVLVASDASAQARRALDVAPRPYRVLFVECPLTLLPAAIIDASPGGLLPLQVVVASNTAVESCIYLATPAISGGLARPYEKFLGRVLSTLVRVAGT